MIATWPIPLEGEAESGPVGNGRLRQIVGYGRKVFDLELTRFRGRVSAWEAGLLMPPLETNG
jgi:hypothetical protein